MTAVADRDRADANWEARNQAYLSAALAWVLRRIDARLEPAPVPLRPAPAPAPAPATHPHRIEPLGRGLGRLFFHPHPAPVRAHARIVLPAPDTGASAQARADRERDAAAALAQASRGDPSPALVELADRFGLDGFERDVLLLTVLRELEPGHFVAPDRTPCFAMAMALFDQPAWAAMAPDRPLRHWHLVDGGGFDGGLDPRSWVTTPLHADERIVSYAKGVFHLDERIAAWLTPLAAAAPEALPRSQVPSAMQLAELAAVPRVTMVTGPDRGARRRVAATAAAMSGLRLYRMAADSMPADINRVGELALLWHRETLLAPVALLVEADDATDLAPLRRFAGHTGGTLVVSAREPIALEFGRVPTVAVASATVAERREAWSLALGPDRSALAARLAAQFAIGNGDIAAVTEQAADADDATLWRRAREQARPATTGLALRVEVRATRAMLALPEPELALIDAIIAAVEHRSTVYDDWGYRDSLNRGLGITALFAGPSGTGKTMAAEVIAGALDLDLYRIDLSAVVSKYIGETEKHLARVFDAAEIAGAVLLFDEADALFGKRSEVKDSHDRYANIEIDYLLQRLECYSGVAILTTNMRAALDPAFTRRLRFIVQFPYPAPEDRLKIWQGALPAGVPTEGLDLPRLAQLDLSGGDIASVALSAAFAAAAAGTAVTMALLLDAARRELRKLDRPVNEAEFRPMHLARGAATPTMRGMR